MVELETVGTVHTHTHTHTHTTYILIDDLKINIGKGYVQYLT